MTATAREEISLIFPLGVLLGQCPASLWDLKGCVRIVENSGGPHSKAWLLPHIRWPFPPNIIAFVSGSRGSAPHRPAFAATEQC